MNDIRIETVISADPAAVYACWTVNALMMTWFCDRPLLNAQEGGAFALFWNKGHWAGGTYSKAEENQRLTFNWNEADAPGATQVDLTFAAEGDATRLTLTHSGFGVSANWDAYRAGLEKSWPENLDNLRVTAENGADGRFLKRPLIGMSLYPISAEHAAANHLPFTQAMHLTVIFDDTPAQQAGLKAGDYLVEFDGVNQASFGEYMGVVAKHQPGDTLNVLYYRDGQMHSTEMLLGKREPTAYPETREALYAAVDKRVTGIEADLEALIAGVPEEVLAVKPAPHEWSANDTLAHMLWAERWYQQVLWLMMTTGEQIYWGDNNEFQRAGILATHPTGASLMAELRRLLREQVEMIPHIPDATMAVRPLYLQLAAVLSLTGEHCRRHYTQVTAAIEHARQTA